MKKISCIVVLPMIFTVFLSAQQVFPSSCSSGTSAHFPSAQATVIDSKCPPKGSPPADDPGDGPQNLVKNNFCTNAATPAAIDLAKITSLQGDAQTQEATLHFTPGQAPKDRTFLSALGEGNLVVFEGYVFEARQECGETVNCGAAVANVNASHDIHIAVLEQPRKTRSSDPPAAQDKEECTGFVAEMIPHHRPAEWTACNVNAVAKKGLRVRITGQQFFDGSHLPCKNGAPDGDNPKRVSLWELHPIYMFEVCPSGDCASGGWQPLEQYMAGKTTCAQVKCVVLAN
jgi:hypothetical protein